MKPTPVCHQKCSHSPAAGRGTETPTIRKLQNFIIYMGLPGSRLVGCALAFFPPQNMKRHLFLGISHAQCCVVETSTPASVSATSTLQPGPLTNNVLGRCGLPAVQSQDVLWCLAARWRCAAATMRTSAGGLRPGCDYCVIFSC